MLMRNGKVIVDRKTKVGMNLTVFKDSCLCKQCCSTIGGIGMKTGVRATVVPTMFT